MFFYAKLFRKLIILIITLSTSCQAVKEIAGIQQLRAESDFRSVRLYWEYPKYGVHFHGFEIHYCELQMWGINRCRTKIIDESSGIESAIGKKYSMHSVLINSLRMSTNYSFEVRPLETRYNLENTKNFGKNIIVSTKGFSAKASLCLPNVSEVEVSTGPFFGGRIAVESPEGTIAENCSVSGDATSTKATYILRIEHKTCDSTVNRTTVSTFILVQETLPILTHSTRRFVVLCTFQPETFTVRAGINMPHTATENTLLESTTHSPFKNKFTYTNEILGNDIQAASLTQANGEINHARNLNGANGFHYMFTSVLIVMSIAGIGVTVWWLKPLKKKTSGYENYTNSFGDNTSVTEIDFGNVQGKNIGNDCAENDVINPTLFECSPSLNQSVATCSIPKVIIEEHEQRQSEA